MARRISAFEFVSLTGFEIDPRNPASELCEIESRPEREIWIARCEAFHDLMDFLFNDGAQLDRVLMYACQAGTEFLPGFVCNPLAIADTAAGHLWRLGIIRFGTSASPGTPTLEPSAAPDALFRLVRLSDQIREADPRIQCVRFETIARLTAFIFLSGGFWRGNEETAVCKRVFSLAQAYQPERLGNISLEQHAKIFSETRAAVSKRVKLAFSGFVGARLGRPQFFRWQKSASAVEKYRAARLGGPGYRKSRRRMV